MRWLKDHWLMLTTVLAVAWGSVVWAFGIDTRITVVEEKITTQQAVATEKFEAQQRDISETKQLVRDIHNHLLNRP